MSKVFIFETGMYVFVQCVHYVHTYDDQDP
jgi:hypothetical protein